ncbi:SEC-C metal-binding domain-containing protein [Sorangium sp. So ce426]|uniref:SEC-C metal-binding domain-containing protein n=1 Tax=Sorangium sp. So ce426 TaxID=3133312 RepID=UPI003F5C207D
MPRSGHAGRGSSGREARRARRDLPEGRPAPGEIGWQDPCPCGSGRKFKRCCGT